MQARRAGPGPKGDINVTPLVDVVLVLLIIFMVITPMLERGKSVALPVTEHPKKKPEIDEQITITVTSTGDVFWEESQLTTEELGSQLAATYRVTPTKPIMVKGDVMANYGRVRAVMKQINEAGFETVGIITKEKPGTTASE